MCDNTITLKSWCLYEEYNTQFRISITNGDDADNIEISKWRKEYRTKRFQPTYQQLSLPPQALTNILENGADILKEYEAILDKRTAVLTAPLKLTQPSLLSKLPQFHCTFIPNPYLDRISREEKARKDEEESKRLAIVYTIKEII